MNVCVFCGSGLGSHPGYAEAAKELAVGIAASRSTLIYGGAKIGLMGVLADEVLAYSGRVIGIIPDFLISKEVGHTNLSQLEIVGSMHERKKRMADLADLFIAMPGGWGTLDELAEILTWKQLGLINQPIGILNTNSYFDLLLAQMTRMANEGFLNRANLNDMKVSRNPSELLTLLGVKSI